MVLLILNEIIFFHALVCALGGLISGTGWFPALPQAYTAYAIMGLVQAISRCAEAFGVLKDVF